MAYKFSLYWNDIQMGEKKSDYYKYYNLDVMWMLELSALKTNC